MVQRSSSPVSCDATLADLDAGKLTCDHWLSIVGAPIVLLDTRSVILDCNRAFSDLVARFHPGAMAQSGAALADLWPDLVAQLPVLADTIEPGDDLTQLRDVTLATNDGEHHFLAIVSGVPPGRLAPGTSRSLLMADISHIRRAEQQDRNNVAIEIMLSRISTRLVGNDEPGPAIENALADVGEFTEATETFAILFKPGTTEVDEVHTWHRDNRRSATLTLLGKAMPDWWCQAIAQMELVQIHDLQALPPEARREITDSGGADHGAMKITALQISGQLAGAVGIYHDQPVVQETPVHAVVLDLVSHIIERAVQLQWKDSALKQSHLDLQEKQVQLVQSEKMATIGQMAAGVAHEINNPVGFIMSNLGTLQGYAETLHMLLDVGRALDPASSGLAPVLRTRLEGVDHDELAFIAEDLDALLAESLEGCERVRDIVQNLKGFARAENGSIQPTDLNACIESTLKIVWNELKYRCEVVKEYGDLPPVMCRAGEINQVIMNLLVNAAQAIKETGTITVTTRAEADTAIVEITDTGCGIPPDILPRVFDPFFTTKPAGKGTGLGLNICQQIIEQHLGTITALSTVGEGTTFTVRLPIGTQAIDEEDLIG